MCAPFKDFPNPFFVIKKVLEDYETLWTSGHNAYSQYLSRFLTSPSNFTNENCHPHFFLLSLVHSASCQIFPLIFSGNFLLLFIYLVVCIFCHHLCGIFSFNMYVLFHIIPQQLFSQTYFTQQLQILCFPLNCLSCLCCLL
jgi:hypothetical protein